MSKGSKVRPYNKEKFDAEFDRIFNIKKPFDHEAYLKELELSYGKGITKAPEHREGAYVFGSSLTWDEYVDEYREQFHINSLAVARVDHVEKDGTVRETYAYTF